VGQRTNPLPRESVARPLAVCRCHVRARRKIKSPSAIQECPSSATYLRVWRIWLGRQSTLMPTAFTTLPHFSVSAAI
jgi:hypothetical protein